MKSSHTCSFFISLDHHRSRYTSAISYLLQVHHSVGHSLMATLISLFSLKAVMTFLDLLDGHHRSHCTWICWMAWGCLIVYDHMQEPAPLIKQLDSAGHQNVPSTTGDKFSDFRQLRPSPLQIVLVYLCCAIHLLQTFQIRNPHLTNQDMKAKTDTSSPNSYTHMHRH